MELEAANLEVDHTRYDERADLRRCERTLLQPRPQPPDYAPHSTLKLRQLRLLMLWESCEAMKLKQGTLTSVHPVDANASAVARREALRLESAAAVEMARLAGLRVP